MQTTDPIFDPELGAAFFNMERITYTRGRAFLRGLLKGAFA